MLFFIIILNIAYFIPDKTYLHEDFLFQIILVNPLCIFAYTLASWKFFNDRIIIEELTLLSFFGEDYVEYQKKVPTGLPFIKGYLIDNYEDHD